MSEDVPLPPTVADLLELARRARMHANTFVHDELGERLLEFAVELEARAQVLMDGGSGEAFTARN